MAPKGRQLKSVTTILFDLDNTLIPTKHGDKKAIEKTARILMDKYRMPEEEAASVTQVFLRNFRLCPHNENEKIDEWRVFLWTNALTDQYKWAAKEIYAEWIRLRYECLAPGSGVISMLKKLRSKYSVGLITNGTTASQWEKIDQLKLRSYFDCILVSGDLPWEKPDKNIFYRACELMSVNPSDCIMVGDKMETDIIGAKAAGVLATVLISPNPSLSYLNYPRPDYVLESSLLLLNLLHNQPDLDVMDDSNSNSSDGS